MIKKASEIDFMALERLSLLSLFQRDSDYWRRCIGLQYNGHRDIFLCLSGDDKPVGFVIYNRAPRYAPFVRLDIPEIQDLFVAPEYRQCGYAKSMISYCEDLAREEGKDTIGIGVGLHAGYGAAQNLYVRLGYVPDGQGVTYSRETVPANASVFNDDDLSLMLIKSL